MPSAGTMHNQMPRVCPGGCWSEDSLSCVARDTLGVALGNVSCNVFRNTQNSFSGRHIVSCRQNTEKTSASGRRAWQIAAYHLHLHVAGFLKRWLLNFARFHRNDAKTKEKGEGREERGKEKRIPGTHNVCIAYFGERQKSTRDTPVQAPRARSTVFKNPGRYVWVYMFLPNPGHSRTCHARKPTGIHDIRDIIFEKTC